MNDVEVVEQRSPARILFEDSVREPDQAVAILRNERQAARVGLSQSLGPGDQAIRMNLTVQEGVRIRAPVVATPAVGVKRRDRARV
jgi:hypothetical protein